MIEATFMDIDDQTLIALLEVTPPDELTRDQALHIRERLAHSAEFRNRWLAEAQWEDYFRKALGQIDASLDDVLTGARNATPERRRLHPAHVILTVILAAATGTGIGMALSRVTDWPVGGRKTAKEVAQADENDSRLATLRIEDDLPVGAGGPPQPDAVAETPSNTDPRDNSGATDDTGPTDQRTAPPVDNTAEPAVEDAAAEDNGIAIFDDAHPLVVELNKEGYNLWAELAGAFEEGAWNDVLRIGLTLPATELGLLPDLKDHELLLPYATMVALAINDHPELVRQMRAEFGPLARIRLEAAMADGDAEAVEAVAVQFFATEAAAEANCLLGDQALSDGDFARACGRYTQALAYGRPPERNNLLARLRLAHAMMGQEFGEPITAPVRLGNTPMAAEEFEQMVAKQRQRNRIDAAAGAGTLGDVPPAPRPQDYKARPFAAFPIDSRSAPAVSGPVTAWGWSAATGDDQLFLSNRRELRAVDLKSGKVRWMQDLIDDGADAASWNFVPMRPLVAGNRIYTRLIAKGAGPELVCLETSSGQLVWKSRPGHHVATQPLPGHDTLLALVAVDTREQTAGDRTFELRLTAFDRKTGRVVSQRSLARIRDRWKGLLPCRATVTGNTLVATVGGVVVCVDCKGNVRWLRRQPWRENTGGQTPRFEQYHGPPLIRLAEQGGDRLIAFQPGAAAVQCLDLATGRIHWEQRPGDVRRVVGIVDRRLVVQVGGKLLGLDTDKGQVTWTHEPKDLMQAFLCGGPGKFAFVDNVPIGANTHRPTIVWLDPATGRVTARCPLDEIETPLCGPLFAAGDRLFLSVARGVESPATRELFQLIPTDP